MRLSLPLLRRQLSVEESKELRTWLAKFRLIEKNDSYSFTFSKSSGPGVFLDAMAVLGGHSC